MQVVMLKKQESTFLEVMMTKTIFIFLMIQICHFTYSQVNYFEKEFYIPKFPSSFEFKGTDSLIAYYDTNSVNILNFDFKFVQSKSEIKLFSEKGTLITNDYREPVNTAVLDSELVIVEEDKLIAFNVYTENKIEFKLNGLRIIGKTDDVVYLSSSIFKNYLDGQPLISNSVIVYAHGKLTVHDCEKQSMQTGKDGFKYYKQECVYFSDSLRIYERMKGQYVKYFVRYKNKKYNFRKDEISLTYPNVFVLHNFILFYSETDGKWYSMFHNGKKITSLIKNDIRPVKVFQTREGIFELYYSNMTSGKVYNGVLNKVIFSVNNLTKIDVPVILSDN